jgi:pimeloyl-ACP methyl ester carboxylesterase
VINKKTPTVYLHGLSGEGESLELFASLYSGSGAICLNMPGFGGAPAPEGKNNHNILHYSQYVWHEIRRKIPHGPVRLVGHSHGAMVAFVLGLQHPDDIESIDLFCPVASPRVIPWITGTSINTIRAVGVPDDRVVRFLAWSPLVDTITRYSLRRDWTPEIRDRIIAMRRQEAKYYSPMIFDFIAQTHKFKQLMETEHLDIPTRICYTSDDNIAGKKDHDWFVNHTAVKKIQRIKGGHLCVVAEPERVIRSFGKSES